MTEDGRDYFECGECGSRAERRIMLDPEMETELGYPVRYVIEMHRGEWRGLDDGGTRLAGSTA